MAEPTLVDHEARLAAVEKAIAELKASAGIVGWIEETIRNNPKVATAFSVLLTGLATWAGTYFSVPATRDVPGPEKVIVREVPAKAEPATKVEKKTDSAPPTVPGEK